VVVSVKAEKIDEFKKTLGNHPYEELGFVTSGSVEVDGQDWGNVFFWKEKYDNAIANLLAVTEAEGALGTL